MKSKRVGHDYMILYDENRLPIRVNKRRTDKALKDLKCGFNKIRETLEDLYKSRDYETYYFVIRHVLDDYTLPIEEGKSWHINYAIDSISSVQETLATDDDIPPEEDVVTLRDIGYKDNYHQHRIWEKVIEDSKEKEVIDEIQFLIDKTPLRRMRTTLWEYRPGVKASKEIKYRKLPIGKKLAKICENTVSEYRIYG